MTITAATPYVSTAPAISHTISLPAAGSGEIIIIFTQPTINGSAASAGFTRVTGFLASANRIFEVLAKVSDGTESSADVTFAGENVEVIAHAYVISGSYADLTGILFSGVTSGNGFEQPSRFNPPSFTPAGGAAIYNWFAVVVSRVAGGFTAGPTNYTSLLSSKVLAADDMALGTAYRTLEAATEDPSPFTAASDDSSSTITFAILDAAVAGPDYTQRKSSTFTATHTLGTITTATLYGAAITINSTGAGTVNLTDTSGVTTSGVYNLVLGDGAATETYTVQLNVFGVVPSNNPAQKDGTALASLTGVQIRITAGANLNGTQVYYSGTETTDASGNFSALDVSTSAAVAADPVRMQVLTAAGDSITSAETVGLI
jgi:hypothetical protein